MTYTDQDNLGPLNTLNAALALIPSNSKFTKLHAIVTVACLNLVNFLSIYNLLILPINNKPITLVLNSLSGILAALYVNFTIIYVTLRNSTLYSKFLDLVGKEKCYGSINWIKIQILVFHATYLTVVGYTCCMTLEIDLARLYVILPFFTTSYFVNISVLLSMNYIWLLKTRFCCIWKKLQSVLIRPWKKGQPLDLVFKIERSRYCTVRSLRIAYNDLSSAVEIYNKLFGWPILIFTCVIIVSLLGRINLMLLVLYSDDFKNASVTVQSMCTLSLSFMFVLVMGVAVAVTCNMTTKEAKKTASVCYTLLLDIPAASTEPQDKILREELILLAQQATHQCPYFSAAGFFNVDYTMLLGLLGTVTSYIIVLLQINK